ncbi:MAG: MFS transporter [Armatimonadetes bacterium]|nr:MFS transporter [Armatimonadota bacterium]
MRSERDGDTAPTVASPTPLAFLLLCGVGLFAIFSSTMSKSPVLPLFARFLGATSTELGFVAAASTYTGIILSIPAGVLSDAWGRKRVLILAGIVFASAPFLYLLVHTPGQLAAVRVYHGAATAIFMPVALAYVADLAPIRRGERMGLYSSATLIGRSLAPLAGGLILARPDSYGVVYLVCGASGVTALALGIALPGRKARSEGRGVRSERNGDDTTATDEGPGQKSPWRVAGEGLRFALRNRTVLGASLMEAMQYLAYGAVETFLPVYAVKHGIPTSHIGAVLGAQIATIALTKPIMGRLSDTVGRVPVIVAGLTFSALATAAFALSPGIVQLAIAATLFGLAMSVVTASTSALAADATHAAHFGSSLGVLSTIMDIGHSSGPVLGGFLVASLGYRLMWGIMGGALLIASLGFAVALRRAGDPSPEASTRRTS